MTRQILSGDEIDAKALAAARGVYDDGAPEMPDEALRKSSTYAFKRFDLATTNFARVVLNAFEAELARLRRKRDAG